MERPQIVVPADVFDTMELACLAFGGIGGGKASEEKEDGRNAPLCMYGYYLFLNGVCEYAKCTVLWQTRWFPTLERFGVSVLLNDEIVQSVNRRKGRANRNARISWAEYCEEGNIVRGN